MRMRHALTAGIAGLALVVSAGVVAAPAQATSTSSVSLAAVPNSIVLPKYNTQSTVYLTVTVVNPVPSMTYYVDSDSSSLSQAPYLKTPIQISGGTSTTGVLKVPVFFPLAGERGYPSDVGGLQKLRITVRGYVPNTDTAVTLPQATKTVKLIARDTAAQSIQGLAVVKPGHAMTIIAESSVNAIGVKASLWLKKSGSKRWAKIATATVKKTVFDGTIYPKMTFHKVKLVAGFIRITIPKSSRALASTSASVRVFHRGGHIYLSFD